MSAQKTIPELAKDAGLISGALDYANERDPWTYEGVISHQTRCPECGADTVPLDVAYPGYERVCLRCLLGIVEYMNSDDLVEDVDVQKSLEESISSLSSAVSVLKADLKNTRGDLQEARAAHRRELERAERAERLNVAIREECDDLRKRTSAFDDDQMATQNENSRLKLEVDKWKALAKRRSSDSC